MKYRVKTVYSLSVASTDRGQIPDGDGTGLAADDERAAVLQQLHRTNVVIALLVTHHAVTHTLVACIPSGGVRRLPVKDCRRTPADSAMVPTCSTNHGSHSHPMSTIFVTDSFNYLFVAGGVDSQRPRKGLGAYHPQFLRLEPPWTPLLSLAAAKSSVVRHSGIRLHRLS